MADVNDPVRRARSRGQMLLVAAFGVAVMLVALALVLNTAIYTENIATRGSDISGGKDAVRFRAATQDTLGESITAVNYQNNTTADVNGSYAPLEEPLRRAIWRYSNISGHHQAMDSIVTNITIEQQSGGTRIYRDADGNFTSDASASGERNWTVVQNTAAVRNFTIDAGSLEGADPGTVGPGGSSEVFYVNLSDSANPATEWYRIYVFNDTTVTPAQPVVRVYTESGLVGDCTTTFDDRGRVTVDVTAATLNGSDCEPLHTVRQVSADDFDVHFTNTRDSSGTDLVVGKYSLVTGKSYSNVVGVSAGTPWPDKTRAIYSATVHLQYESKRLYLETDIRAAPGEFDD